MYRPAGTGVSSLAWTERRRRRRDRKRVGDRFRRERDGLRHLPLERFKLGSDRRRGRPYRRRSSGNPWVVNGINQIFRRSNGTWLRIPGRAQDIGIGADGSVWIIGAQAGILTDLGMWGSGSEVDGSVPAIWPPRCREGTRSTDGTAPVGLASRVRASVSPWIQRATRGSSTVRRRSSNSSRGAGADSLAPR